MLEAAAKGSARATGNRASDGSLAADSAAMSGDIVRRLRVLNRLLTLSTEVLVLEEQLRQALDMILSLPWLSGERKGVIFLGDEESRVLRMVAARGLDRQVTGRCGIVPFGRCACGRAADIGDIIFVDFDDGDRWEGAIASPNGHYCLPIRARDRLVGVLTIYIQPGYRRDPDEEAFLVAVTHVLSTMISHRQIEERTCALLQANRALTQRLVTLQEQQYRGLARELHDELGQSLTAIRTHACLIAGRPALSPESARQSGEAIVSAVDRLHDLAHSMIRRLRPSVLDDLGLAAALETLVAEWRSQRPGLPCGLRIEGDVDDLGEEVKITAFRFVQEALTNVLRHAAATKARVSIVRCTTTLRLRVEDDGRGMDAHALRSGRKFGLLGMRERVEGLGGRLDLDSAPGTGVRLTAVIPLCPAVGGT